MDYQGVSTPVEIDVFGEDYNDIQAVADSLKAYMAGLDMLKWVHSDADWFTPSVSLELDHDGSHSGVTVAT